MKNCNVDSDLEKKLNILRLRAVSSLREMKMSLNVSDIESFREHRFSFRELHTNYYLTSGKTFPGSIGKAYRKIKDTYFSF